MAGRPVRHILRRGLAQIATRRCHSAIGPRPLQADRAGRRGCRPSSRPPDAATRPPALPLAPATRPDEPLEIAAAAGVDERLFLIRALETLYEGWPDGSAGPEQLRADLDALRHEAVRHRRHVEDRGLGGRIASLYADLEGLVDAYSEAMAEAGRIGRRLEARAEADRADGAARSGFAGGVAAGRAVHGGATGGEALGCE